MKDSVYILGSFCLLLLFMDNTRSQEVWLTAIPNIVDEGASQILRCDIYQPKSAEQGKSLNSHVVFCRNGVVFARVRSFRSGCRLTLAEEFLEEGYCPINFVVSCKPRNVTNLVIKRVTKEYNNTNWRCQTSGVMSNDIRLRIKTSQTEEEDRTTMIPMAPNLSELHTENNDADFLHGLGVGIGATLAVVFLVLLVVFLHRRFQTREVKIQEQTYDTVNAADKHKDVHDYQALSVHRL